MNPNNVRTFEVDSSEEFETYCQLHPRSPAAVRRPKLINRGRSWVALLGPNIEDGIAGIGATVEAALRAFDVQYHNWLQPR